MSSPNEELQKAADAGLPGLSAIRKEMTQTIEVVAKIAERSSSTTLCPIGGGLLLLAFGIQVSGRLTHNPALSPGEFVAVLVVATVILLGGAAIRVYQSDKGHEAGKQIRDSGVQLVTKGMDIGADLAKRDTPGPFESGELPPWTLPSSAMVAIACAYRIHIEAIDFLTRNSYQLARLSKSIADPEAARASMAQWLQDVRSEMSARGELTLTT